MKKVRCPRCGSLTPYSPQNQWRPFCSERCKMIDLGQWAAERYRITGKDEKPDKDER